MRNTLFALITLSVALCAYAATPSTPCFARITATARTLPESSWMIAGVSYQIYDITVVNEGTCSLNRVVGFFSAGPGFISESWNYDKTSGLISGYGGTIAVGGTFNGAGFVLANSTSPTLALARPGCPDTCTGATTSAPTATPPTTTKSASTSAPVTTKSASTSAPATTKSASTSAPATTKSASTSAPATTKSASTSAPATTKSASTSAPATTKSASTSAPATTKSASTAAPRGCDVSISVVKEASTWLTDGRNTSVYRVVLTNNGPCPLVDYATSFAFFPGTILSSWNLQPTLGGYLVQGYGPTLAAGATYNGAGLIIAGAPNGVVTPTPYGSNCQAC